MSRLLAFLRPFCPEAHPRLEMSVTPGIPVMLTADDLVREEVIVSKVLEVVAPLRSDLGAVLDGGVEIHVSKVPEFAHLQEMLAAKQRQAVPR